MKQNNEPPCKRPELCILLADHEPCAICPNKHLPRADATIDESHLSECMRKGEQAWKDVPDATAWVEELRGGSEYPAALIGLPNETSEKSLDK
jgi:hypothetical protein